MVTYPAIVIAAYNRPHSLQRLLNSIEKSHFPDDVDIPLIISIDKGENQPVVEVAEKFKWRYGRKQIIIHENHLGLKNHILSCGDFTAQFQAIIMLEDDLVVSPWFYDYAMQALSFYGNDERLAGISLYSYQYTEMLANNRFFPFKPLVDNSDVYFMQIASSWGQIWQSHPWQAFRKWLVANPDIQVDDPIPDYLKNWPDYSWKRLFIKYMILHDLYFVFPRTALSTNFGDAGTTATTAGGFFQVPLLMDRREFRFKNLDQSIAVYDSSFELDAEILKQLQPELAPYELTVDLYGSKKTGNYQTPYVLTSRIPEKAIKSYGNYLQPNVLNIIFNLEGEGFHLAKKEHVTDEQPPMDFFYQHTASIVDILYPAVFAEKEKQFAKEKSELHDYYQKKIDEKVKQTIDYYQKKITESVREALDQYKFNLEFPRISLIIPFLNHEKNHALRHTLRTIEKQQYPNTEIVIAGEKPDIPETSLAVNHVPSHGSWFECLLAGAHAAKGSIQTWCMPGAVLMDGALTAVKKIFNRYLEVNWLVGLPMRTNREGTPYMLEHYLPNRWNNYEFRNASAYEIEQRITYGSTFWRKKIFDAVTGYAVELVEPEDLWRAFINQNDLYTVAACLIAFSAENSLKRKDDYPFESLPGDKFLLRWMRKASRPFFLRDIPYLRSLHANINPYPPILRFDYSSDSFYFSNY